MQEIKRTGTIIKITPKAIYIKINHLRSCEGCSNISDCSVSRCKEKLIKLPKPKDFMPKCGEEIQLQITHKQNWLALFLSFMLPLICVISSLIIALKIYQQSENNSAIIALSVLALYYLILSLFKPKLNKIFSIGISPK